jgi:hypothetical protein
MRFDLHTVRRQKVVVVLNGETLKPTLPSVDISGSQQG